MGWKAKIGAPWYPIGAASTSLNSSLSYTFTPALPPRGCPRSERPAIAATTATGDLIATWKILSVLFNSASAWAGRGYQL
jgi:hypothetical protein